MIINTNELIVNNIVFKYPQEIEIEDDLLFINKPYKNAKCNLKEIKEVICDGKTIIKNGKIKVKCSKCEDCPLCKKIELRIPAGPSSFTIENGFFCGKEKIYSDDIKTLKKSKIKSKHSIELQKCYKKIEEKYKRRREKYITEDTIKTVIKDIEDMLSTEYGTYNEYGHECLMLESIRINKNDYGYELTHDGRIGDNGWYSTIYIHKKCNIRKLEIELRKKYRCDFECDY